MAPEDEVRDLYVGKLFDHRYEIIRQIGKGGMGAVYEARHHTVGRKLAMKILFAHLAGDAAVVHRFKNEARAIGMLQHPHIVEAIDFGRTEDGAPYIVMEFLEGQSLASALRERGPFEIRRAIAIADQIAQGLAVAHERGIVHRDVKPENVFLAAGDHVKLLDFGISKFAEGNSGPATQTGAMIGSPHYMAPEQIVDSSRVDARTDVYALGAVLYEMLTGRTLYRSGNFAGLVLEITQGQHEPVTACRSDVPAELSDLIARLVARTPNDRPKSMEEVRTSLAPFAGLDLEPRLSAPVPLVTKSHDTTPFVSESEAPMPRVPTSSVARPLVFGLGLLALTGVGAGVFVFGSDLFGDRALDVAGSATQVQQPPIDPVLPDAGGSSEPTGLSIGRAPEATDGLDPALEGETERVSREIEQAPRTEEAPTGRPPGLDMRPEPDVMRGETRPGQRMQNERVDGVPLLDDY